MTETETRAALQPPNANGARKLSGYAVVFNSPTTIGTFTESIAPDAWTNTGDDVLATWNHNSDNVLGRTRSGTLTLTVDSTGVRYNVDLPDTELGRSVHELVKRGDVFGSSFTFIADEDEWDYTGEIPHRTVTAMRVIELGPVHTPAYPDATVSARALERGNMSKVDISAARKAIADSERADKLSADIREAEANGEKRGVDPSEKRAELDALNGERAASLSAMKSAAETRAIGRKASAGDLLYAKLAESRNLTSANTGGAFTPAEYSKNFVDLMAPSSVVLSSGVNRVATNASEWKTPVVTSDFTPAFVGELADLPTDGFAAGLLTVKPMKLATSKMLSSEFVNDSDGVSLNAISRSMLRALALGFDKQALSGTAGTDTFVGIANTTGIQNLAVTGEPADLSPFAEAFGMLEDVSATPGVVVMNPTRWAQLLGLKDSTGRQLLSAGAGSGTDGISRSILGVPVKVSPYVDANTILVYDASEIYAVIRKDATFETSSDAGFFKDGIGARAIMRAAIAVPNAAAVVKMTLAA
ncbi:phage major capsid protein [Streptomyces sp. HGB0020]|uniref:phage major capsid protein n=1 Tax=Streptomyces sp. HGB0020 TaxID=1078086 RepID=UPI00034E7A58|nr:phage major capsid protein [Streptomyces sp. HGB0020]EPD60826.1 HK97 family phage major capsid protein [Streptomyces sp. HGB0020]